MKDEGFDAILEELRELHERKGADYGTDEDQLANIRASEGFGVQAWMGAVLRANDKMSRLKTFCRKGMLRNESVEDSLRDLAVYAIISLQLYREGKDATRHYNPFRFFRYIFNLVVRRHV